MSTLIIGDKSYVCNGVTIPDVHKQTIKYVVECSIPEAVEVFTDDPHISVEWDTYSKDYDEFKLLQDIKYIPNSDSVEVMYRKMSDLEKLIELHYGGVNNEGSI